MGRPVSRPVGPEAALVMTRAAPLVTIQDRGRVMGPRWGMPTGGVLDRRDHHDLEVLTTTTNPAVLEVIGGRADFEVVAAGGLQVATAGCQVWVNGSPSLDRAVVWLPPGTVVQVAPLADSFAGQLIAGAGFDVPLVATGRGTDLRCGVGGMNGRALRVGDALAVVTVARGTAHAGRSLPPRAARRSTIRVMPAPQTSLFSASSLDALVAAPVRVSMQRDRMAVGLEIGGQLDPPQARTVWSLPTAPGEIQVDGASRVHVLAADRQTIAGYPRIATVISADIDEIANAAVGAMVHLRWVDRDEALMALRHERSERDHRHQSVTVDAKAAITEALYRSSLIGGAHDASHGPSVMSGLDEAND